MQVSDLNNNLLKAIAGSGAPKTANEGDMQFAELLSVVRKSENEFVEGAKDTGTENLVSKTEIRPVTVREQDIKDSERLSKNESSKDAGVKEVENDKKIEQKQDKEEISSSQDSKDSKVEKNSDKVVESVKNNQESFQEEDVVTENVTPVVPVVIANNENQLNDVLELVEVATDSLLENVSDIQNQEISVPENASNALGENNVDMARKPATVQNVAEIKTNQVQPETVVDADVSLDDAIIETQEREIEELLPEGKKVEIKVNVSKDTVVATVEKETGDLFAAIEDVKANEVLSEKDIAQSPELLESKNNQVVAEAEMPQHLEVSYIEAQKPLESVKEVSEATNSPVEVSPVSGAVSEIRTPVEIAEKNTLRNIENKGLTREIAEQIKVNITQSAIKGVDKIEIQLKPADLGQIEVKLQIGRDGRLHAHIVASNAETLDLLQKDLSSLKEAFNSAGYLAEDDSFSFGYRGERQDNERQQLREFIGEVITHDVEEETAANDYISADGVNIRV